MITFLKKVFLIVCPSPLIKPAVAVLFWTRYCHYRIEELLLPNRMKGFCPCCGRKFQSFVPGPFRNNSQRFNSPRYENTKQEVLCPICRSFPRHRILALWGKKHEALFRKADILFFAPVRSERMWMKRNHIPCVTADLYSHDVDLKIDIQNTGLPAESSDIVICNHVLEHVDDFRKALKEMYRILRPGGSFISSFPMDPNVELLDEDPSVQTEEERVRRFGQNDHLRVFGMKADRFLTEAGFEVERIEGKDYPEEILPVVGPADYDINLLFRCVKPG